MEQVCVWTERELGVLHQKSGAEEKQWSSCPCGSIWKHKEKSNHRGRRQRRV